MSQPTERDRDVAYVVSEAFTDHKAEKAAELIAAHVAAETAALIDRVEDLEEALREIVILASQFVGSPPYRTRACNQPAIEAIARAALAGKEGE